VEQLRRQRGLGAISALTQIDKSNVTQLQQVWCYSGGNNRFRYGFNPLVVDGVMYVLGKNNGPGSVSSVPTCSSCD
jgi:quinoprotein glucose dehydrogenase